nr:hypothetical protein [Variovorax sp. TBS-050B]
MLTKRDSPSPAAVRTRVRARHGKRSSCSGRGRSTQAISAARQSTSAMPVHTRLSSSPGVSASPLSATEAPPSCSATSSPPNIATSFQCTTVLVRSSPLAVTLNGRPKGRSIALASVLDTAMAATSWLTSLKIGRQRRPLIQ